MKHLQLILMFSFLNGCSFLKSYGQYSEKAIEPFAKHSSIGLVLNHAHVFNGRDDAGDKKVLALPSWGIDYNYYFHPKWGIGLHTDIILESFKVEGKEGIEIERTTPIAPAIMGIYKPGEHWNFLAGIGGEFAEEENFLITRFGVEYGAEIQNGWEVSGSLLYDIKWKGYDSWVLGIGISKSFGSHKKKENLLPE
ncbi:MAG: hypothetical protein WD135_00905 [Ferruginibacter sp.]